MDESLRMVTLPATCAISKLSINYWQSNKSAGNTYKSENSVPASCHVMQSLSKVLVCKALKINNMNTYRAGR